jgi:uncharacterized delta-60 repeat protein
VGEEAALAEYTSTGALDTTFGSSGKLIIDFNLGGNSAVTALKVEASGLILIGGYAYNPTLRAQQSFVARLTSTGVLDQTFGTGGVYLTQSTPNCSSSEVSAFADLLAGDVGALFTCYNGAVGGTSGSLEILGLASNGTLDPLFGANGIASVDIPSPIVGQFGQNLGLLNIASGFMTETSQGLYVAAGSSANGQSEIGIERVQSNGQPDQSFGVQGQELIGPSSFGCTQGGSPCPDMNRPQSIATQLTSGGIWYVLIGGQDSQTNQAAVLRLLPNGLVDQGFGNSGVADAGFGGPASAIATQQDGGVLVGGTDSPSGAGADLMAVARLKATGALDSTFGNMGYSDIRFGSYGAQLTSLAVDGSGDYVAAGATLTNSLGPLTVDFAVMELAGSALPPAALPETGLVLALPLISGVLIGACWVWRRRRAARLTEARTSLL